MSTPVRRDSRLVPLSHDHHRALGQAREVVLALDGRVPQELPALAARCARFFADELAGHFMAEERWLIPPFAAHAGAEHPLVRRALDEHRLLRALSEQLALPDTPAETALAERLAAWSQALTGHVRFEEREFFPAVEQALDARELDELGRQLAGHRPPACHGREP